MDTQLCDHNTIHTSTDARVCALSKFTKNAEFRREKISLFLYTLTAV